MASIPAMDLYKDVVVTRSVMDLNDFRDVPEFFYYFIIKAALLEKDAHEASDVIT